MIPDVRGYGTGKHSKGRKRHVLVDTLGLPRTVVVTTAAVQDHDSAHTLLAHLPDACKNHARIWDDDGFAANCWTG